MTELGRGIYEHLITYGLDARLGVIGSELVERADLDPVDAHEVLGRHIAALTTRALRAVGGSDREGLARQVAMANQIAETIAAIEPRAVDGADQVADVHKLLTAIADPPTPPEEPRFPVRPSTPLSSGALLVNGRNQPRIGHEVATEMASADEVDLLCAFIKWYGLRLVERPIRELIERGGRVRVITTTYLGATDQRALDRLVELGAEVKVSYETRTTRLHAKAWLFRRHNGASTAYVGSSNLSKAALVDGLEWNIRVSNLEQPSVINTFEATFTDYWSDPAFEPYDPAEDGERLRRALRYEHTGNGTVSDPDVEITNIDVRPYGYQREILADLAAERIVHGRYRNLVVMATGTGKTVVAALDYRELRRTKTVESLLFVAHREEILRQSRSVFRHVLRDGSFGEILVGGERPTEWRHVFASIQSLQHPDFDPSRYDMVIVDEFHHAAAPTYTKLLEHVLPRVLLGLTATPDRADGEDVRLWFGGHAAVELHLWEALERQLLAPFQYFGLHDDVDLSTLTWKRGQGYEITDLNRLYTGNDARARFILQAVRDKVDVGSMRALGFCVSIGHAEFMAEAFTRAGVPARAVTSKDTTGRRALIDAFKTREVRVLFTVDLFNEGVDLPMVDTILMLRPTESATIFLQQLGRGLRLDDNKACLTVLDFIGGQHANFRFDLRWRALTGVSRRAIETAVREDFPTLPSGCHVELDRVAKEIVLANLKSALPSSTKNLTAELRQLGDVSLAEYLRETGLEVEDLYRRKSIGGWAGLRRLAGLDTKPAGPDDRNLGPAIGRMLHLDDPDRLGLLRQIASGEAPAPGRLVDLMYLNLWGPKVAADEREQRLIRLWSEHPDRRAELGQLYEVLRERMHRVVGPPASPTVPLRVHARYSRNEVLAGFGVPDPASMREGVKWVEAEQADIFFVTLVKSERHYSPTTMYADRSVTPELFQWESQSTTSSASPTGQRYINHRQRGSSVHLFVRETKERDGDLGVPPYLYAGPMTYESHTGDRPMRILWRLHHELPATVFHAARITAA